MRHFRVALFMGAWIETRNTRDFNISQNRSHSSWVRGLKLNELRAIAGDCVSHSSWVRGLKPSLNQFTNKTF